VSGGLRDTSGERRAASGERRAASVEVEKKKMFPFPFPTLNYPLPSQRDGEQFATGGMDHKIHVYNTNNGNPIHVHMLTGHTHYVMSLDFNRQNGLLISAGGHDRTVRVWNTQQSAPKLVHTIIDAHYKAAVSSAQWYPDGSLLLSISRDEMLKFWDINNYLCKNVLDHKRFHNSTNLKITADGFYMLGGNMDKTIRKLILPFSIFSILIK